MNFGAICSNAARLSENSEDEEAVQSDSCTYALGNVPVPVGKVSRF